MESATVGGALDMMAATSRALAELVAIQRLTGVKSTIGVPYAKPRESLWQDPG